MLSCATSVLLLSSLDAHSKTYKSKGTMGGYSTRLRGTLGRCVHKVHRLNVQKSIRGLIGKMGKCTHSLDRGEVSRCSHEAEECNELLR